MYMCTIISNACPLPLAPIPKKPLGAREWHALDESLVRDPSPSRCILAYRSIYHLPRLFRLDSIRSDLFAPVGCYPRSLLPVLHRDARRRGLRRELLPFSSSHLPLAPYFPYSLPPTHFASLLFSSFLRLRRDSRPRWTHASPRMSSRAE